jgi:hypothetical protein
MPIKNERSVDSKKLAALRAQRELLRRLREDLDRRKGESKAAKDRCEKASMDLERMVSDSNQGELFPGVLHVDPRTGEIVDYSTPDSDDAPDGAEDSP